MTPYESSGVRNLRLAIWAWRVVMVSSLTGVIVAAIDGNWFSALWAACSFVSAAACLLALRRWLVWRGIAERAHSTTPPIRWN